MDIDNSDRLTCEFPSRESWGRCRFFASPVHVLSRFIPP